MDMLEVNRDVLNKIAMQYPESVKELSISGDNLVFGSETCDLTTFNLNDLMMGDSEFASSLASLNSEDVFRIIRLHVEMMAKSNNLDKSGSKEKMELIKQENPMMKNVSVVERPNGVGIDEFINIVDSKGENHLFRNDTKVDVFGVYETLKMKKGDNVTPDDLIAAINQRLYEVRMSDARDVIETDKVSEDFSNKMKQVNDPYKTNNGYAVSGNEQDDIAVVTDLSDPQKTEIKTFNEDQNGLVINSHSPNVNEFATVQVTSNESSVIDSSTSQSNETTSEKGIVNEKEQEDLIHLISLEEFFNLFSPTNTTEFSSEERKAVDLYYGYFGDLILYEDYLLPELRAVLNRLRNFVLELEINLDDLERATVRQRELINKRHDLEEKKKNKDVSTDLDKDQEYVRKLLLEKPNDSGSISTLQVLVIIIGIAIILTAITLAVLS